MRRSVAVVAVGIFLLFASLYDLSAQGFCQLSHSSLNKDRKVMGPVSAECPGDAVHCFPVLEHSIPFGNWGVSSNVGHVIDGHQFNGWCRNHHACDNYGNCGSHCTDPRGWYEWNSCTTHPQWAPQVPVNCTLYNSNGCTQQVTTRGVNTHGSTATYVYVSCPYDSDGDGFCDSGGCEDVYYFYSGNSWMTLYEIDICDEDERVQRLNFPSITVSLNCDAMSCNSVTTSWLSPTSYATPSSPVTFARLAVRVNWGRFSDRDGNCALRARGDSRYDCL